MILLAFFLKSLPLYTFHCPSAQFLYNILFITQSHCLTSHPAERRTSGLSLTLMKPSRPWSGVNLWCQAQSPSILAIAKLKCNWMVGRVILKQPITASFGLPGWNQTGQNQCVMDISKQWDEQHCCMINVPIALWQCTVNDSAALQFALRS